MKLFVKLFLIVLIFGCSIAFLVSLDEDESYNKKPVNKTYQNNYTNQQNTTVKKATPTKKATTVTKATPTKKATTVKKATPTKKTTTVKKATPTKKATTVKKATPTKKATTVKKATPTKKATTTRKTCPHCGGTGWQTQYQQYYDAMFGWQSMPMQVVCGGCAGRGYIG